MEKVKVLIVDDNPDDLYVTRRFLLDIHELNIEIFQAKTAKEAVDSYQEHKPDCILSDFHLPDMSGLQFLEILKKGLAE